MNLFTTKELAKSNASHASGIFQRLLCNLHASGKALRDRLRGLSWTETREHRLGGLGGLPR